MRRNGQREDRHRAAPRDRRYSKFTSNGAVRFGLRAHLCRSGVSCRGAADFYEEITYADVNEMTYLTQCFHESARLFPGAPRVDRVASRDVTIKGISIEKGTAIGISIIGRHMDPEIWPEPEKFDPDRFSPEEKARHSPFDHMPFGYGPRNCIAMRLALMEVKLAAALVLKNFTVLRTPKTEVPIKFKKFQMISEKGIWLKLRRRNEE